MWLLTSIVVVCICGMLLGSTFYNRTTKPTSYRAKGLAKKITIMKQISIDAKNRKHNSGDVK